MRVKVDKILGEVVARRLVFSQAEVRVLERAGEIARNARRLAKQCDNEEQLDDRLADVEHGVRELLEDS